MYLLLFWEQKVTNCHTFTTVHMYMVSNQKVVLHTAQKVTIKGINFGHPIKDKDVTVDVFIGNGTCSDVKRVSEQN